MALTPAEKSRRYRERKAAAATGATATDPATITATTPDDIPFNSVTVTATAPETATATVTETVVTTVTATDVALAELIEQLRNATATVTGFAQQIRRWVGDVTDRIAIIEALLLENTQTLNKLRLDIQTLVTVTTPKTVIADVTGRTPIPEPSPEPPVTKPERPRGPISAAMQGFRPVGSVLPTSLKNLPQPPMDNPYGKDPEKPT